MPAIELPIDCCFRRRSAKSIVDVFVESLSGQDGVVAAVDSVAMVLSLFFLRREILEIWWRCRRS